MLCIDVCEILRHVKAGVRYLEREYGKMPVRGGLTLFALEKEREKFQKT